MMSSDFFGRFNDETEIKNYQVSFYHVFGKILIFGFEYELQMTRRIEFKRARVWHQNHRQCTLITIQLSVLCLYLYKKGKKNPFKRKKWFLGHNLTVTRDMSLRITYL